MAVRPLAKNRLKTRLSLTHAEFVSNEQIRAHACSEIGQKWSLFSFWQFESNTGLFERRT
jgi:hypothetical protein